MGDLISRKNVIDVIRETVAGGTMANTLELRINDLPSAEPSADKCWGCNCPKMEGEKDE